MEKDGNAGCEHFRFCSQCLDRAIAHNVFLKFIEIGTIL